MVVIERSAVWLDVVVDEKTRVVERQLGVEERHVKAP